MSRTLKGLHRRVELAVKPVDRHRALLVPFADERFGKHGIRLVLIYKAYASEWLNPFRRVKKKVIHTVVDFTPVFVSIQFNVVTGTLLCRHRERERKGNAPLVVILWPSWPIDRFRQPFKELTMVREHHDYKALVNAFQLVDCEYVAQARYPSGKWRGRRDRGFP